MNERAQQSYRGILNSGLQLDVPRCGARCKISEDVATGRAPFTDQRKLPRGQFTPH